MSFDNLMTYGWALWCPIAGQLWDWGIDPEIERSKFMLEESWFLVDDEEEYIFEEIEGLTSHIKFSGNCLFIRPTQWPPLHVWIGVALRLMSVHFPHITCAHVVSRNSHRKKEIKVMLTESAKVYLEKSWEELGHGFVFQPRDKCQVCFIKDLCWFLQEA
ncbi:hypothetical protein [Thermovirga sp.]|uniref:hypothetical protein n=1 Tax=Thermovirga sp. TaxID=2699834 RepID=UPI0025E7DB52|nr:hypothetical protein [Thermovirga sp.]MBO8154749.1 hypothetical protein [Thermovirga sp.]